MQKSLPNALVYDLTANDNGLQEIFFVANKVHKVVVITTAGGHSFYKKTQIRLGQVQHRFVF
jgi:hypothetical protein